MSVSQGEGYNSHWSCTLKKKLGESWELAFSQSSPFSQSSLGPPVFPRLASSWLVVMVKARG